MALPIVITKSGLRPLSPVEIRDRLVAAVTATNPGYTVNLPGILIEDILSTDVAAVAECDSARVETVNSLTPYGANEFVLNQLGQMLGVPLGVASNTSVFLRFSSNAPGFVIGKGFTVSDGSHQYTVQDGGSIQSDGDSPLLFALATAAGSWAVPPNTVVNLVTSVPASVSLTVTNPQAGLPGLNDETAKSYRTRVLTANLAASQGMARYLRTLLSNVEGVQPRLIAAQPQAGGGWKIICGGGDPYAVAYAIYTALFDVSNIVGSEMVIESITNALPALVTTLLNHGYSAFVDIEINDSNPSDFDGEYTTLGIPSEKTFRLGKRFLPNALAAQSWSAGEVTFTTTTLHGVTVGSDFTISGSSPSAYNGDYTAIAGTGGSSLVAVKAVDPGASVTLGQLDAGVALFDSTGLPPYVDGGIITPNNRNITVSVLDYPDVYPITFINPPQQTVTMTVTWNTNSPNFVSDAAVAQVAGPALVDYINAISVGQPINIFQMEDVFQNAVRDVLPVNYVSRLTFSVAINGVPTLPDPGTFIVNGDPESYFFTDVASITVVRG